jgi:hypothetical protein
VPIKIFGLFRRSSVGTTIDAKVTTLERRYQGRGWSIAARKYPLYSFRRSCVGTKKEKALGMNKGKDNNTRASLQENSLSDRSDAPPLERG